MPINSERCQFVFQKTGRSLLKLSSGQRPEQVHSFRTTSRRLQTLLEDLIPQRSRNEKKLLKLVTQIRKRAGKVRDLDVQLAALRTLKIPQEPRRKTQLMHALIELRAKHENKLRKLLTKDAIRETRKRLKRASKQINVGTDIDPLAVARQMLAQVRVPEARLTEQVMHRYRVVVKRARYAAEFAPESAGASQFLEQLQRLQDALGDWHDWLTLTHTATARLGDVGHSPLVAALHNLTGSKFRRAVTALSASPTVQPAPKAVPAASTEQTRKLAAKTPTLAERAGSAA